MALHLIKLCVGIGSLAELDDEIAARLERRRMAGEPPEQVHTTRVLPKRAADILDGGSLFWVIRGQVAGRQVVRDIRPFTDSEGVGRCHLVLEPAVAPVEPRACRPFQGWRYLEEADRPADLAGGHAAELPEGLRYALRELCLL